MKMAETYPHPQTRLHELPGSLRYLLGGSLSEGFAGAGAVAVSIIAIADGDSMTLISIATILVGLALLFEGGSIAARFSSLINQTSEGKLDSVELGAGMSAQLLGGLGVVTLGILSLLGITTLELTSVAAIIAGGSVLLGAASTARINAVKIERSGDNEETRGLAHAAVSSAASMQLLIGIGATVLGILAVLSIQPAQLASIAMLAVGFSVLLSGAAISGLSVMFRR
jgi:hypothetical protein